MEKLEQTLSSVEIADMIDKEHSKLLRDIRRYIEQFNEAKIGFVDFFKENTYVDAKGETRPCYRITKKGCEFIAHKLTGVKGTIFTARYINRFHEMQDILLQQKQETEMPWFIRKFRGRYIVLWRDFSEITGFDIESRKPTNWQRIKLGADYNGWGWKCDNDAFKKEFGFDYGTAPCMMYFYPNGAIKVLRLLEEDRRAEIKQDAYEVLTSGLKMIREPKKSEVAVLKKDAITAINKCGNDLPIQIRIIIDNEAKII